MFSLKKAAQDLASEFMLVIGSIFGGGMLT